MPSIRPTLLSLIACLTLGMYWLIFLRQPIVEGVSEFSRGAFVLNTLLLPESVISTWTGGGRLAIGWLDRLPIVLMTAAWLVLAWLVWPGHPRLSLVDLRRGSPWLLGTSLSVLLGLALLSTATLIVGLAGGLSSPVPLLITLGLLVVTSWLLRHKSTWFSSSVATSDLNQAEPSNSDQAAGNERNEQRDAQRTAHHHEHLPSSAGPFDRGLQFLAIALTLGCAGMTMLGAWVPPAEFDVLEYHLQAPKEFYQQGSIGFVPHNIYANMPLGVELHSLAAMTLWSEPDAWLGGLVGKSISAAISLLGAALVGSWLAGRYGPLAGWWSAGIWLATPGIAHVAMQGLIDGALATYCLATAVATWQLLQTSRSSTTGANQSSTSWAVCASVLAGATAAIKYPGLIFATLPCLVAIAWCGLRYWSRGQRERTGQLLWIAVAGLAITCVPWYAKNWMQTGNPVYPLAAQIFGGQTLTPAKIAQWQKAHQVPPAGDWPKDAARLFVTSSFVQPTMILGMAVAVMLLLHQARRHGLMNNIMEPGYFLLGWSLWLLAVWWLATHRIDRFWLPITGLWAALAAWGLWQLSQRAVWLAHAIVLPGLLYGLLVNCSPIVSDNRYFVSLAALRDDIGDQDTPPRVPLAQAWINQHLTNGTTKVLLIGEARIFEYRVPVLYSTCFDINPGETLLVGKSLAEQRQALQQAGITHIMLNWNEIDRYRSPGNYGFSQWPQRADVQALIDSGLVTPVAWDLNAEQAQLLEVNAGQ